MNTYETMKHNIPEGATHYQDEGNGYLFAWFKEEGDSLKIFVPEAPLSSWTNCFKSAYEDLIKPIPHPTYRYEKVTDSIFDLKEEFERGELFEMVGVEIYREVKKERYFAESFFHETLHRRVEVTERELFIEEGHKALRGLPWGAIYDAGCRFVNGKG